MARCRFTPVVLGVAVLALAALAQAQSPDVGNAVLLAGSSIQMDRDGAVVSGDLVANNAGSTLTLNQNVSTPAGFALRANSVVIGAGGVIGGSVYANSLQNGGTIKGAVITPVSLPFIASLPQSPGGTAGTQAVIVGNAQTLILGAGSYGNVSIGRDATLRLSGGTYVTGSVTGDRGASIIFDGGGDVVVNGNLTMGQSATIANAAALTTKHKIVWVSGTATLGKDSTVKATINAAGALSADQNLHLTGSLLGATIAVASASSLQLRSGFRNLAPVANAQDVSTSGGAPITITLTGFDGDGDPLVFSIATAPAHGTLGAITQLTPTSASVVYTPSAPDTEDAFVFRVTDSEGASAQATVSIDGGRPAPPAIVSVDNGTSDVLENEATTLTLTGSASNGATLSFSITGSGPAHGTLGPIAQPATAGDPATVVYTPASNYIGPDSFQFQGCASTCAGATFTINVAARSGGEPGNLASDFTVSTPVGFDLPISLPGSTSGQSARFALRPSAAVLVGAQVAGNVADANGDGFGDSHNALPGSAPVLMSAGVGQSGGAGSNGTVRMELEWDVSSFAGSADALQSATVLLHTNRGTVDAANTFFYWGGADNDGQLTDSDFEQPAEQIGGANMPVPPGQQIGQDGTFSFDVLAQLRAALKSGSAHFTVQGRVDEATTQGAARGLQVYTTASGNLTANLQPQLGLATAGVTPPLTYRILSLPSAGTLVDSNHVTIASVPYNLPSGSLTYLPPAGTATTTFTYDVSNGVLVSAGTVRVNVVIGTCATDGRFCNNGRGN